ncbi:MAG: hypothetical protein JSW40_02590 [Candidatus Omnitrophota bacterium]|nr:MAG: hypothetical protein JSW40_02590 [Candidatus Omnitrophota bacterium]
MRLIRIIVYALIFFFVVYCPAQEQTLEERLKLLPQGTELIEHKTGGNEAMAITKHKYYSESMKGEILKFYRQMFVASEFEEMEGVPAGQPDENRQVFFFKKPNLMVMLSFFRHSERGETTYYLVVYRANPSAIQQMMPRE